VYSIELRGMDSRRDLLPVFIDDEGTERPDVATWLLDRAMSTRREDFAAAVLPDRGDAFEAAVTASEMQVVGEMLSRQQAMETTNADRLEAERRKLERFFDYRAQAAADKVAANERTLARLRESPEDADRRILPVWEKNVETSRAMLDSVEHQREQTIAELAHRDHVSAQHQLIAASYVSIEPDPAPLFAQVQASLTSSMFATFKRMCTRTTAADLLPRRSELTKRRQELARVADKLAFDLPLATAIADALIAALDRIDSFTPRELNLLSGAISYFLVIDDEDHDLKSPNGFEDDRAVANIVLEAIGVPELRVVGDEALAG
jgi:hypothetical protein